MPRKFGEIAFTPEVKAAQAERGSRHTYEKYIANGPAHDTITPKIESQYTTFQLLFAQSWHFLS